MDRSSSPHHPNNASTNGTTAHSNNLGLSIHPPSDTLLRTPPPQFRRPPPNNPSDPDPPTYPRPKAEAPRNNYTRSIERNLRSCATRGLDHNRIQQKRPRRTFRVSARYTWVDNLHTVRHPGDCGDYAVLHAEPIRKCG